MYYCFVSEELTQLEHTDPLVIQANYAKQLGLFCCCELSKGNIYDSSGQPIEIRDKRVFLRTTYDLMKAAIEFVTERGGIVLESLRDIYIIEHWDGLALTRRPILAIKYADLLDISHSPNIADFLLQTPKVFIKSRKKNFSAIIPADKLLLKDKTVYQFFMDHCPSGSTELLLSEALKIKKDFIGKKEARYFVFEGKIMNASRSLHSITHTVPKSLSDAANLLVLQQISKSNQFPKNYVLDIGLFVKNGVTFADIVELNPITCSLCYVKNSIFFEYTAMSSPDNPINMGVEFCFDAITYPERYPNKISSNSHFSYINLNNIDFS